jgi:surface protein
MKMMFFSCVALTTVALFNTHNVVDTSYMFSECENLTAVPLFNTYNVIDMSAMFYRCYKVQYGALALYLQASSQSIVPSSHYLVFTDCGRDTSTGSAELAQIPTSWGGTLEG